MGSYFSQPAAAPAPSEPPKAPNVSPACSYENDDGAGVIPRQRPTKRAAVATTDLSDRHIRLCAQDAIIAAIEAQAIAHALKIKQQAEEERYL